MTGSEPPRCWLRSSWTSDSKMRTTAYYELEHFNVLRMVDANDGRRWEQGECGKRGTFVDGNGLRRGDAVEVGTSAYAKVSCAEAAYLHIKSGLSCASSRLTSAWGCVGG